MALLDVGHGFTLVTRRGPAHVFATPATFLAEAIATPDTFLTDAIGTLPMDLMSDGAGLIATDIETQ